MPKAEATTEVELAPSISNATLTHNTARILIELCLRTKIIIVADRPVIFLSTLRKHWLAIGRKLQRERASTFDPTKINALCKSIDYVYKTQFSSTLKDRADILVVDHSHSINEEAFILICNVEQKEKTLLKVEQSGNDFIVLT